MVEIGKRNIRVYTQEYKGRWYVHIRTWYEKDGEMRPGKGAALNMDEWREFVEQFPAIKEMINQEADE